jgi:hypothetical protein
MPEGVRVMWAPMTPAAAHTFDVAVGVGRREPEAAVVGDTGSAVAPFSTIYNARGIPTNRAPPFARVWIYDAVNVPESAGPFDESAVSRILVRIPF